MNKKMNNTIIIFTDRYPYGKAETFLENEIRYFSESFRKIMVFPLMEGEDKSIRKLPDNVILLKPLFENIKKNPELIVKGLFNNSPLIKFICKGISSGCWKSPARLRTWFTHLLMIRAILSEMKKLNLLKIFNDCDLLFFNWGLRWSQIIPFLQNDLKPKIIVRFHGTDLYEHLHSNYIPWRNEQIKRINSIITVSETGKKYLSLKYGIHPDNIFLSRIGTQDCGLNPYKKSDIVRIVSCSNIVPVKRVELIIATLKYLKTRVEWIHFGEGALKQKVLNLASELPGTISWKIPGEIKHDELINFYRSVSVDFFINVSSSEGVPVSVMEALSFGIPVIATAAGGTAEIVSDSDGIIIPVDFVPESLAGKIERIITSENYMQLRTAARKTWEEKCREDKLYPGFIEFLEKL
ncbi:MAG: glycosyltransferase [Bacteroidales bacterium]